MKSFLTGAYNNDYVVFMYDARFLPYSLLMTNMYLGAVSLPQHQQRRYKEDEQKGEANWELWYASWVGVYRHLYGAGRDSRGYS